ncbi:hypothetical protein BR10RB9215_C11152 [Brucella sp. 10RB9215]|nr:hypothetical protein BR10RB9215_C11152 [Brucella sp. 10RB9215]
MPAIKLIAFTGEQPQFCSQLPLPGGFFFARPAWPLRLVMTMILANANILPNMPPTF